jgi:hypothetical protein
VKKKRKLYQASLRFWLRTKWQLQQCTGNQDVNIIGRSGTREVGLLLVSHRTSNLASLRPPGGSSEMPEAGVCALMQSTHCSIWFLRAEAGFPLGLIEHQQWRKSVRTELRQVGSAPTWNTGGPGTNVQLESVRESQQRRLGSAMRPREPLSLHQESISGDYADQWTGAQASLPSPAPVWDSSAVIGYRSWGSGVEKEAEG